MKSLLCLAAVGITAIAAPAGATVITFDSAPSSFTTYTTSGVTFTASGQLISTTNAPGGSLGLLAEGSPRSPIRATFASAYTGMVSIDLGDYGSDADLLFLDLYSSTNALLGSTTLLITDTDSTMHTLSTSAAGISYAIFGSKAPSVNGSSVFADNFTFTASSGVPEPATWALMVLGFGAAGHAMRRRKAAGSARATAPTLA